MFEFEVVGFTRGTYTDRRSGENKPYTRIYCTYPLDTSRDSSRETAGTGTDTIFIKRFLDDLQIGDKFSPVYNKYGTCIDINIF